MLEKPKVVATRFRRSEQAKKGFSFSFDEIPPGHLFDLREKAWSAYSRLRLPSTLEESWRRTDLRSLPAETFHLPDDDQRKRLPSIPRALLRPLVPQHEVNRISLAQDDFQIHIDPELEKQGVIFTTLRAAEDENTDLIRRLIGKTVNPDEDIFSALTSTYAKNGTFLYIPSGVKLDKPLHSITWVPGSGVACFTHTLVWLENGAEATFFHEIASPATLVESMHGGILEVHVGEKASLTMVEMQSLGRNTWNFMHSRAHVERNGSLDWIQGNTGSKLTKEFTTIDLRGEGASGRLSGFYFVDGNQHLDMDTQQNHLAPHTSSDLLYKGALMGESRSVWQGMIYVAPAAQKTDGYQANRNLILSQKARADSIPGLEILADDVRCTHGATAGKLDPEPLFYLRSRGLTETDAKQVLVEGFFDPVMQRIPFDGIRNRFRKLIVDKMKQEKTRYQP